MNNKERFEKYCNDLSITPTSINWKNGYFIIDMGEDSVVHFRIKGIKGFLFAIWFNYSEMNFNALEIKGIDTFFYQSEIYIDKFKPSRSACFEINMHNYDEKDTIYTDSIKEIQKELAQLRKFKYQMIEELYCDKELYWKARKEIFKTQCQSIKNNLFGHVGVPSEFGKGFYKLPDGRPYFLKCLMLIKKYGYKNIEWEYVFIK